jgi:sensor histidine kinase YesM
MSEIIQTLILTYIEATCCSIFFHTFLSEKEKKPWIKQIIIILFAISTTQTSVLFSNHFIIRSLIINGFCVLFMKFLYISRTIQAAFFAVCYHGILLTIDGCLLIIVPYLAGDRMDKIAQNPVYVTVLAVLCKVILFVCIALIYKRFSKEREFNLLKENEWLFFMIFPTFSIAVILLFFTDLVNSEKTMLIVSFGMLIENIILFYLIKNFIYRTKQKNESLLMQEKMNNQLRIYQNMDANYKEQLTKTHEFKNQLLCIQELIKTNENEKTLEYIGGLSQAIDTHMNFYNVDHPVINAIVNQKYHQAKKDGITIIMSLSRLSSVKMPEVDLVVLLSNLLDNAIEASRKVDEDKRYIWFRFVQDEEKTMITVKNPVLNHIKIASTILPTTKESQWEHGIGMKNINSIVEKYGGESTCSCRNMYFYFVLIFNNRLKLGN